MDTPADKEKRKKTEILAFLHEHVFDPSCRPRRLEQPEAGRSPHIMRLEERDPAGIVSYYWSAIVGTDRSVSCAPDARRRFTRFEEIIDEFRIAWRSWIAS